MKKLLVVAAVVLLLLGWLFFGDLPSWMSRSDSRPELSKTNRRDQVEGPLHSNLLGDSRSENAQHTVGDATVNRKPKAGLSDSSTEIVEQKDLSPLPRIRPIDAIIYIRSSTVFEGEDPSSEEIARLNLTVSALEKVDPRRRIVLDADAVGADGPPFVLYANPELDVTKQFAEIFDRFDEFEDLIEKIAARKVEQAEAPDAE